ncbi:MAG: Uma2 family endonuclease [Rhodothermales bacterium]
MQKESYSTRAVFETTTPDHVDYTLRRFSTTEYFRMGEAGILQETDRVELIDGEILVREPEGSQHASHVHEIAALFYHLRNTGRAIVRTNHPAILDDFNVPQPDVAVVKWRDDRYVHAHPTPADILLAIEVSWTTLLQDRGIKAPLYARAGIPELWIVDLKSRHVEVYREPSRAGYASFARFGIGSTLRPHSFEDVALRVDDLLLL